MFATLGWQRMQRSVRKKGRNKISENSGVGFRVVYLALPAHPWRWIAPDLEKGGFMFNRLATMRHSSILILAAAVTNAVGISARGQTESKKGYKYI
jgi:hypothetical protein